MRFSIPILALLSGPATALPAVHVAPVSEVEGSRQASGDGRGATIWTEKNFHGTNAAIPANAYCTDFDNIFGQFDGKVRSIKVEAGYKCSFYTSYGCPSNANPKLEFGRLGVRMIFGDMGPDWDLKIHSTYCAPISKTKQVAPRTEDNDTPVVTLYAEPNPGWRTGSYITLADAYNQCQNLNAIPGHWANVVSSLIVYKEHRCEFYTEFDCPANGNKLEYGQHEVDTNIRALSGGDNDVDNRICSIKCQILLSGSGDSDVE